MPSPSDFPEKVWRIQVDGLTNPKAFHTAFPAQAEGWREIGANVQPYFSAPLVEELVEASQAMLVGLGTAEQLAAVGEAQEANVNRVLTQATRSLREAVSKAQSSLGVKG